MAGRRRTDRPQPPAPPHPAAARDSATMPAAPATDGPLPAG